MFTMTIHTVSKNVHTDKKKTDETSSCNSNYFKSFNKMLEVGVIEKKNQFQSKFIARVKKVDKRIHEKHFAFCGIP